MSIPLEKLLKNENIKKYTNTDILVYWRNHPDYLALTHKQRDVLRYIVSYAEDDTARINAKRAIKEEIGGSLRHYRATIKALIEKGFIEIIDRDDKQVPVYRILVPDNLDHNPDLKIS